MPSNSHEIPRKKFPVLIILQITGDEEKDAKYRLLVKSLIEVYGIKAEKSADEEIEIFMLVCKDGKIADTGELLPCDTVDPEELFRGGKYIDADLPEYLSSKMSRKELFHASVGYFTPFVYWFADIVEQLPSKHYVDESGKRSLDDNKWYRSSCKACFSFCDNTIFANDISIAPEDMFTLPPQITGLDIKELVDVLSAHEMPLKRKLIPFNFKNDSNEEPFAIIDMVKEKISEINEWYSSVVSYPWTLPVIFVTNTSGASAASINQAMSTSLERLKECDDDSPALNVKIGILNFGENVNWMTNGLESVKSHVWEDLPAGEAACLGAALYELDRKMLRKELFVIPEKGSYHYPLVIFLISHAPTDDWKKALLEIAHDNSFRNRWLGKAYMAGFVIGKDEEAEKALKEICSTERKVAADEKKEKVICPETAEELCSVLEDLLCGIKQDLLWSKKHGDLVFDPSARRFSLVPMDKRTLLFGRPVYILPDTANTNQCTSESIAGFNDVDWDNWE